ncbi:MAG TPA: S-layer homology domain-containing protein, partial [Clostridia bacterium]
KVVITNIDKVPPVITVNPYSTKLTNQSITVTASTNEGTLKESTHTFDQNGDFTFEAADAAGNTSSNTVKITNIDKTPPVITIDPYDTAAKYNSITVTASVNKGKLKESSHTFTKNEDFTFEATDDAGNTATKTISITNILAAVGGSGGSGGGGGGGSSTVNIPATTVPAIVPQVPTEPAIVPVQPVPHTAPSDISGHWAEKYIKGLMEKGIVNGYADGTFKPDYNITRAEASVIIVKALDLKLSNSGKTSFKDDLQIPVWAKVYVNTGFSNGIITGYEDNTFRASNNLTRAEMSTMIVRAFKYIKSGKAKSDFIDDKEIPAWAKGYIIKAVEVGAVSGYPDKSFKPSKSVTRAEVCKIIYLLLEKK